MVHPVMKVAGVFKFDGDELNIHVPQSIESRAELEGLMHITWNILTPQAGQPCMNLVQDCMSSIYAMSIDEHVFAAEEAMQMYAQLAPIPPLQPFDADRKTWFASDMLSWLLPPNFTCSIKKLRFEKGHIMRTSPPAPMTSKEVGVLIHLLCRWPVEGKTMSQNASLEQTALFLTYAQRLGLAYFGHRGFSVGIKQCLPSKAQQMDIRNVLEEGLLRAEQMAIQYHLERKTSHRIHEMNMTQSLEGTSSSAGAIAHAFIGAHPLKNSIDIMMTSGAKGKINNIMQMSACVGQQIIGGQRPKNAYTNRALTTFDGMSAQIDPKARGYIQNSYVAGMNPAEFFAAAQGGREGLTDTSIKTQEPGYFTRQLTKNFENLDIQHGGNGSVRDDGGNVIQFKYGEDGFDPMCLVAQKIDDDLSQDVNTFLVKGGWMNDEVPEKKWYAAWRKLAKASFTSAANLYKTYPQYAARLPLDVRHILHALIDEKDEEETRNVDVDRVLEVVFRGLAILYFKTVRPTLHNAELSAMVAFVLLRDLQPTFLLPFITSGCLSTRKIRDMYSILKHRWCLALIQPGEKVGVIAAQSLGQLAMQATLNTSDSFSISLFLMSFFGASKKNVALYRFHLSGTGNTAVSTGFPRLRGLVHIAKQEKQKSSLTLSLLPPYNTSEAAAINVATRLRFFRLIDFVKTCDIIYTKNMNLAWFSRWKDIYANTLKAKMLQFSRAWPFVVQWIIRDEAYPVLRQIKAQDVSSVLEWLAVKINEDLPHVIVVPSPDQHHTLLMFIVDAPPLSSDEQPFSIMQRLSVDIPENIHLSGVIGIEKIHVYSVARKSAGDTKEFRLECQGGCLTDCFDLMEVDPHRSVCNDPKYIELTYGIEAGRASMVKEMNTVLEETAYVDPHHVSLLVDWMGYTGSLRPVNRHTQNKIKSAGVIDRSTNEETMAVLSEGAMNARSDELKGISGQLATGRLVHAGTGVMQMRIPLPNI